MPQEDRYIQFTPDEVYTALRIHGITQNIELPAGGTIVNIDFSKENSPDATVALLLKTNSGAKETLDFSLEFFARALVFFCQGNNIPIPRAGTKQIMHKDGKILMHIKMS